MNLETIRTLAEKLGYPELNELQQKTFAAQETYDPRQNLMVIGPTSSGKTLVPKLLYYAQVLEAVERGLPVPKMLFVVPYRALAAQKVCELQDDFNRVFGKTAGCLICRQSTSEYRQADAEIQQAADIHIAVTINEKAFLFASRDPGFLQRYQYIVFDEIGLLKDESRGIKLDFLMTWIRFLQEDMPGDAPRMLALGTPFYNWDDYAESFSYYQVKAGGRPQLREIPVYIHNSRSSGGAIIEYTGWPDDPDTDDYRLLRLLRSDDDDPEYPDTTCPVMRKQERDFRCPQMQSCRRADSQELCPQTGEPCKFRYRIVEPGIRRKYAAIAELCRYHLQKGRQILIFWNDRYLVRELSGYLYQALKPLLEPIPQNPAACRQQVLDACTEAVRGTLFSVQDSVDAFTEDELAGIFDDLSYQAYCAGVGFHSSALPPETRAAVENDFLGRNSRLRIVCSTETLAYGINSAVDVVIVADLHKNTADQKTFLRPIEYQNYAGRAGRLKPGKKISDIVGYVYPIIDAYGPHAGLDDEKSRQERLQWAQLKADSCEPELITSTFYSRDGDYVPFMLLCLIPAESDTPSCIRTSALNRLLQFLPRPKGQSQRDLSEMLAYLEQHGLIRKQTSRGLFWRRAKDGEYYTATDRGAELKGYTPSRIDYDILLSSMQNAWDPEKKRLDNAALIYWLLDAGCLTNHRDALHLNRDSVSHEKLEQQLASFGYADKLRFLMDTEGWRIQSRDPALRRAVITAAILTWAETANPRILNEQFGIGYPLLQALTRELSYLLSIAEHSLVELKDLPEEEREEQKRSLRSLERSIVYGFPAEYYERLMKFFDSYSDPAQTPYASPSMRKEAGRIVEELNALQPVRARQIRKVVLDCTTLYEAGVHNEAEHEPYGGSSPMRTLNALQRYNRAYTELWCCCIRTILDELERAQKREKENDG